MRRRKKIPIVILALFLIIAAFTIFLLRRPSGTVEADKIDWGVAFSKPFAIDMGLNWQEAYLAILDELKPKFIRLPIYWQDVERQSQTYNFADYDWLVEQAKIRNIKLILVIGRKVPRWPECHLPNWALALNEKSQQAKLFSLIPEIINRYKNLENLYAWQVENEPFLSFGECPKLDVDFLDKEISLARSLDNKRPIIITDSGELSVWLRAVKRADIFGTTMYRIVYNEYTGYFKYPLPPKFFWLKANLAHLFYPGKPIIVSELQAEPWGPKMIYETSLEEQNKSMNLEQFYDNIEYARAVGFPEVCFWGAEWWYWLKTKHNQPEIWEAAQKTINP